MAKVYKQIVTCCAECDRKFYVSSVGGRGWWCSDGTKNIRLDHCMTDIHPDCPQDDAEEE